MPDAYYDLSLNVHSLQNSVKPYKKSATYFDVLLSFNVNVRLTALMYDTLEDFNFNITNFLFLSIKIPSSTVYGVLIRNSYVTQRLVQNMKRSSLEPDN